MSRQGGMVYARITPEEWDFIRERMREAGMTNTSAYIRKMALNGYVINVDLGGGCRTKKKMVWQSFLHTKIRTGLRKDRLLV